MRSIKLPILALRLRWPASSAVLAAATSLSVLPLQQHAHARSDKSLVMRKPHATANADAGKRKSGVPSRMAETYSVSVSRTASRGSEQKITKEALDHFVPGTNPLKMLEQVPGVSFSSADPLGVNTWGASLYLRGFFMSQLAVTLDDIPLDSQQFGMLSGVNVNGLVIPDDLEQVSVSQGGGSEEAPSASNLGGSLQYRTSNPDHRLGVRVTQTFGSYGTFRTYGRIDSGDLNRTGTRFFVSYARTDEGKWKGTGTQFAQQIDAKLIQPIGQSSQLTAFFNRSSAQQQDFGDLTLATYKTLGGDIDSFYPNYAEAYAVAAGTYIPPGYGSVSGVDPKGISFYDSSHRNNDYVGGLNLDATLTNRLRLKSTFYGYSDAFLGTYGDPFLPSPNGAPLSEQVARRQLRSFGFRTDFLYHLPKHDFDVGVWYANQKQGGNQFQYTEPLLGEGEPLYAPNGPFTLYGPPFQKNYGFQLNTNIFQFHLMDTFHLSPSLTLHAGFKSLLATTSGGANYVNQSYEGVSALPNGSLTSSAAALPHFSINWRPFRGHEFYVDIAKNMRAYDVGTTGSASPWGVSDQATFKTLQKTIRPERDWVYQIGYRYTIKLLTTSLSIYHADILHRLQSASIGTLTQAVSTLVDSGDMSMYGVDAALTVRPIKGLSIFNSVSYNHSTYGADIPGAGMTYATKGKKLVNYPQFMFKSSISYQYKGFSGAFHANYYSKRYFSYVNDTSVPAYWLTDMTAKYDFGRYGIMRDMALSFSVYNLFNHSYIAMMGENGNPMSGDYQSLEVGAPRTFFGTLSARF